jgi:hypothetical protein
MVDQISPLLLSIQLETARLTSQVAQVQGQLKSIDTTARATSTGFDGFGNAIKGVAGKIAGLAAAYVSFSVLQESMNMAVNARKSMVLFEGQLERSTGATRAQIAAVNDQIKALSTLSAVSGGTIRTSFQKLVTVTGDLNKSLELQTLAMDVAAGTGRPLSMVTLLLGRASTGTLTALNRLVPGITAVKDPMAKLAATFKGAAAEAANNDPYARMELRLNSIKKTIGDRLLVVIDAMDRALTAAAPTFKMLAVPIGQATKALMPFITALGEALSGALKKMMPSLMKFVAAVLPPLINLMNKLMPVIILSIDLFVKLFVALEPFITALTLLAVVILDQVIDALVALANWLKPVYEFIVDLIDGLADLMGLKPKVEIDASSVHDAHSAYLAVTEAQKENAQFAAVKPPKTPKADTGTGGGDTETPQQRAQAALKQMMGIEKNYRRSVAALTKQSNDDMAQLTAEHQKKIGDIMREGIQTLTDIVRDSQNRLRDAFKNVTQIDAGNMFIQAGASITNFVAMLKDKLTATKRLAQNAADLAAAGYSQTFIEQIISQGPDIGSELSKQLLAATPEQATQIQLLFGQVDEASLHAVDEVAMKITEQQGLATEELRIAYANAQAELTAALMAENETYSAAMIDLTTRFNESMLALDDSRDKALRKSIRALNDALGTNAKNLNAAMRVAEREMGDSAERMIARIRGLLATSTQAEQNAILGTGTMAPVASIASATASAPAATVSSPINISIAVSTNASPDDIAMAVSNAIKYNLPYTVAGAV